MLPTYNLFINLITLDSLYSAYDFVKHYYDKSISESQIILKTSTLYKGSLLDRYIIYVGEYVVYSLLCVFFWQPYFYTVYGLAVLSTLPVIINKMLDSKHFNLIRSVKEKIVKTVIAKQFTKIIKTVSKSYLDKDVALKHRELLPLLDNYKGAVDSFLEVLKNGLLVLLLSYLRKSATKTYYRLTKYFYSYKTGDTLKSFNADSAKKTLLTVIETKDWGQFKKPNVYSAILQLHQMKNEETNVLSQIMFDLNFKLLKMFSIWSLAALANLNIIACILSFIILMYRDKKYSLQRLIVENIIIAVSYFAFTESVMITSFVCQFGYNLIINPVTFSIFKFLKKRCVKCVKCLVNDDNLPTLTTAVYSAGTLAVITYMCDLQAILLSIIYSVYTSNIFYLIVVASTYFSNFSLIHIFINSVITFICYICYKLSVTYRSTIQIKYSTYDLDSIESIQDVKTVININSVKNSSFEINNNFM